MENPLVGILLVGETSSSEGCHLGLVHLPGTSRTETLSEFRSLVTASLEHVKELNFVFVTPHGWEVSMLMEQNVMLRDVVSGDGIVKVQISHIKPKYGIIIEGVSDSSLPVGFLFCASNISITQLKDEIRIQLPSVYSFLSAVHFAFLDINGWPISRQQESAVTVLEVACSSAIRIRCATPPMQSIEGSMPNVNKQQMATLGNLLDGSTLQPVTEAIEYADTSLVQSFADPDISSLHKSSVSSSCEILISYVHTEASSYALLLKTALQERKYNVFLDIHCIQGGTDWHDALNNAISNCSLFIPLITSQYGQTLWTNREVKLADVLGKVIIPVNFLGNWPPKCLAIQFATTQFVAGIKNQSTPEIPEDIDYDVVAKVATEISDRYSIEKVAVSHDSFEEPADGVEPYNSCLSRQDTQPVLDDASSDRYSGSSSSIYMPGSPLLLRKKSSVRSYASTLPSAVDASYRESLMRSRDGKPLIVICCAPQQQEFVQSLVDDLNPNSYEIWCSTEVDPAEDEENARTNFQQKADEAGVVIFVLSEDFAESAFCEQQVYYCEQRKRMIPLIYKPMQLPGWMAMLIGTSTFISCQSHSYKSTLLERVDKLFNPKNAEEELKKTLKQKVELANMCSRLSEQLPTGKHVYISGGTQFYSKSGKAICESLGKELAKDESIVLITGGFYGVGETVSKSFHDERLRLNKPHGVCHVVAIRDKEDKSNQTRQNPDGTFAQVPFGDTLFFGESVREREMLTPRVVDLCILVEGGPGAAFEAQQFAWNGNQVIPVKVSGGAASGLFNIPSSVFVKPQNVNESNWLTLADDSATPEEIASALFGIVQALKGSSISSRTRCSSTSDLKLKKRVSIKRSDTLPLKDTSTTLNE